LPVAWNGRSFIATARFILNRRQMPKSSWMIPRHHRHRHRKSKSFRSLLIRRSSGLAAVGNGATVGFGLAAIGDRVRIRVPFGCAAAGCIVVIIASGLKAIGVDWSLTSRARKISAIGVAKHGWLCFFGEAEAANLCFVQSVAKIPSVFTCCRAWVDRLGGASRISFSNGRSSQHWRERRFWARFCIGLITDTDVRRT
jgi:hypothetical protein